MSNILSLWLQRRWNTMLFKTGRLTVPVSGLNAFATAPEGLVRLVFIVGPHEFVGYYLQRRPRYNEKVLAQIANDPIVAVAKKIVVTMGFAHGGQIKKEWLLVKQVSTDDIRARLMAAESMAFVYNREASLRSTIFNLLKGRRK